MLLHPTGGLVYHFRALRYRRSLWVPFIAELNGWLAEWRCDSSRLLLVGASGGYCLENKFLARFASVAAIDPDPAAKLIFRARHGARAGWNHGDYFAGLDPAGIPRLLADYPEHAVLFCNLLGQLHLLHDDETLAQAFPAWKRELARALAGRPWASFHDRVSGPLRPEISAGESGNESSESLDEAGLIAQFYRSAGPGELVDHQTGDLFPGFSRRYFRWEITPGHFHLIESVKTAPFEWKENGEV